MRLGGCLSAVAAFLILPAFRSHPQSEPEKELGVEFQIVGDKTVAPGQGLNWTASLVNRSKETTYAVVKPGDGSTDGMREPFVYFTAKRKNPDGEWEEVPKSGWRRECGTYAADWQRDVVSLKPGDRIPLKDWLHPPSEMLELQKPGPVRIQIHYRYRGGKTTGWTAKRGDPEVGGMKGMLPFVISSEPFEITVVRPLEIRIRVKGNLKKNERVAVSSLLEIELVNTSKDPVTVCSPVPFQGASLRIEAQGKYPSWNLIRERDHPGQGVKEELGPGLTAILLGGGELSSGIDGELTCPVEGTLRLRAHYYTRNATQGLISDWVELKVEK